MIHRAHITDTPLPGNTEPMPITKALEIVTRPSPTHINTDGTFRLYHFDPWTGGDMWNDTCMHVERMCEQCFNRTGAYPEKILLSSERYHQRRKDVFYLRRGGTVPLVWDEKIIGTYEILLQGRVYSG